VRSGEVTSQELAEVARTAIDRLNGRLNAVIEVLPEAASPVPGHSALPFAGVPFLIKDLGLSMRGIPCDAGSRLLHGGQIGETDSELLERFRSSGVTIIGRTNAPELGYSTTTEPVLYGPARNPWNLELSPGGSSGGSAAAVAAGIVPIAHGTDAGGSIRIPAAACGVVGLKPTRGRNPTGPHVANPLHGLAGSHILSRTVRDAACMLDAVVGASAGDPFVLPKPDRHFWPISPIIGPLKIAFTTVPWRKVATVSADCVAAVEHAAAVCVRLGHHIDNDRPFLREEAFHGANRTYWSSYILAAVSRAEHLTRRRASPENLEACTWQTFRDAHSLTALDIEHADTLANEVRRAAGKFFTRYDVLLTPTMAVPPWPLGALNANDPGYDPESWYYAMFERVPFTALFNMTGQPAISLPLAINAAGLPIGVQLVGRVGDDATVLALASQLEGAEPWCGRSPPVHHVGKL
jgi:amidase